MLAMDNIVAGRLTTIGVAVLLTTTQRKAPIRRIDLMWVEGRHMD